MSQKDNSDHSHSSSNQQNHNAHSSHNPFNGLKSLVNSAVNSPIHSNVHSPFGSTTNMTSLQAMRSHTHSPTQITSSNEDGGLINNILPSYHMYQSTVSKNLIPSHENFTVDPPMYEMTPVSSMQSSVGTPELFPQTTNASEFPFPVLADPESSLTAENAAIWENTILANAHRLPNLTSKGSNGLSIDVHVTEKVCQKGVQPTELDPSNLEFKQGDFIHGYVTILNKSPEPIPFEMVYVVFEGIYSAADSTRGMIDPDKPLRLYKFLNMLDLFASWTYANIDRLVTDNGDPHDWCDGEIDPYDNTVLSIDVKRLFQPNVTYKRYFSFRIPEKLLDDACEIHSLNKHTEVPPSLGITRKSVSPSQILANKESQVRDLSFIDAAISYSVDARIIGKASDYNFTVEGPRDQYVIATEATCPIRVIPMPDPEYYYNRAVLLQESKLFYKAFSDNIRSKIISMEGTLENNLVPTVSGQQNKLRQLYSLASSSFTKNIARSKELVEDNSYQCIVPIKKKSLTGSTKVLGILSLSTPREEYRSFYAPPIRFRSEDLPSSLSELNIPLEFSYFVEGSAKTALPEIKSLSTELVVLTIKSRKHPIPIEFNHDMCFRDKEVEPNPKEVDNFDTIVIKQFQQYLSESNSLILKLGNEVVKFETKMYKDLKCLATLQTKYINLSIQETDTKFYTNTSNGTGTGMHSSIKTIPWELESKEATGNLYSKKLDLRVNLNECHLKGTENKHRKGFDYLTLVPSFQSCMMARMYYMKVTAKVANGDILFVNVPLTMERL